MTSSNRTGIACAIALLAIALVSNACGDRDGGTGPGGTRGGNPSASAEVRQDAIVSGFDVLLLTLDTTRADHLACYGHETSRTPVLDGLAADGTRFEAAAQAPITLPAHASVLSGLVPPRHGARVNGLSILPEQRTTLAERLQDAGYATAAVTAAFVLDRRFGLAQGFEIYDDDRDAMAKPSQFLDPSRDATAVTDAALKALDELDPNRPWFLWAHYFDPHFPYTPPPDVAREFPNDPSGRYLGEIAYMDREIGRLLDGLRERGRLARTVVVAVGDHGEGFPGPHEEDTHGFFLYDDTLRVPLLVSAPAVLPGGRVSSHLARQVDIAPTILDLVGAAPLEDVDGESIAHELGTTEPSSGSDPHSPPPETPTHGEPLSYAEAVSPWYAYGWATLYQVRDSRWKYIDAPEPELYHMENDPAESRNLSRSEPERVRRMQAAIDTILDSAEEEDASRGAQRQGVMSREMAKLQALGYVLSSSGTAPPLRGEPNRSRTDPKTAIGLHDEIREIDKLILEKRIDEAIDRLRVVDRENPENPRVLESLAKTLDQKGDVTGAQSEYERLIEAWPKMASAHDALGDLLEKRAGEAARAGQPQRAEALSNEAVACWKKAIEHGIMEYDPMLKVGIHHLKKRDWEIAESYLTRGLALEQESFDLLRFVGMAAIGRGDLDRAGRALDSALALAEGPAMEAAVRGQLADLAIQRDDPAAAAGHIEVILRLQPEHPGRARLEETLRSLRGRAAAEAGR